MASGANRLSPATVAIAYLAASVAWILGSDALLATVAVDAATAATLQTVKGLGFVVGSTGLLWSLLHRREQAVAGTLADLDDARERFESVVAASPLPIVALDADGRVEVWNEAAESTFGWDRESVLGEPIPIVPDGAGAQPEANLEHVLDGGVIQDRWIERETADGDRRTVSLSAAPVRGDDGDVRGVMAVLWDVTEREARERALAGYRDLVDNLPVGVFRTAPRGRDELVDVNPAMVAMFEADSAEALLGRPLSALTVDEPADGWFADASNGDSVTEETRFRALDGDLFWARTTAIRREDDAGQPYVEGIMADVSDRKERERQLAVLDRVLRHNLRNKMCVIQGRARDVETWADGRVAEAARGIRTEGQALLDVVDDQRRIVDLVSSAPEPETREVAAVVEAQVAAARDDYPAADFTLECPPEARAVAVTELHAAVGELLDNAVRHADSQEPTVDVSVDAGPDAVAITVADDGPGIPDPEVEVLTHEREIGPLYHGSGMGLWLVHWIVRLSGGSLRFRDNEPRGSVVTVALDPA